jgi:hypothetical protein
MATASIQSLRNGSSPVSNASRDDLSLGDVVTLSSLNSGTSYAWNLAYRPEGSTAVFSSTGTTSAILQNPGDLTIDVEGSYLIRLQFTDGTGVTEQYVRLRALTSLGSLKLVAAGERYDIVPIPVDATPSGWADDQNYNLNQILGLVGSSQTTAKVNFSHTSPANVPVTSLNVGDVVVSVYVRVLSVFDGLAPEVTVGTTADPDAFMETGDSSLTIGASVFSVTPVEEIPAPTIMELNLSGLTGATQGSGILVAVIHRA